MPKPRLPSRREMGLLGNRPRLVFPSIGSVPGASGTYWKSDLTLHNPLAARMSLVLRYVSGDTRIDRQVVLAAGHKTRRGGGHAALFFAAQGRDRLSVPHQRTARAHAA